MMRRFATCARYCSAASNSADSLPPNDARKADDPRQQLAYLAVKRWARLFCPDVIPGVYTPDELEDRQERIINPDPAPRVSVQEITESEQQNQTAIDNTNGQETKAEAFRARIDAAETLEAATAVGNQINEAKKARKHRG